MPTILETSLPADVAPADLKAELENLTEGVATIEMHPVAKSGHKGQLGQIDPSHWQIVVQLLDTQAAAAAVHSVSAVIGFLFARTGMKPKVTDKPDAGA